MGGSENNYCRFCAEPKSTEKLLNLDSDEVKYNEILIKLTFLNALYVDVSTRDTLPKTVCFVCYESLNKAYEFLDRVKKAQDVLTNLFPTQTQGTPKFDLSDDDRMTAFDDFDFLTQDDDVPAIKLEAPSTESQSSATKFTCQVKLEPADIPETNILQDTLDRVQTTNELNETLNVQDILDAALNDVPYTSNVTIYAKELTNISKKVITSWKEYPWVCAGCNIEFLDISTLRSHSKTVHGKCSAFVCVDCKTCGKKDNLDSFLRHVRKHRKLLRNVCLYCDQSFEDGTLSSHTKLHFLKSQVPCPACGEIVKNEDSLRQHLQDYPSVKPKRKPRRKAGTPITLEELTCHICKKVYKNPNSLRDHVKRHTIDRKRNYTCDRCGKTFFNKGTLTSHIMLHDQIRPHLCRICNKSFLFPNMLRRHVDMHSGVKPFACDQCGRRFRLQYQLNAHKIIHTDAMPHVCQYCNKAFRFKQILKNHERQHTGAKPYCCQHCGMEFSNWSNYNKHMKRRHGTDTSKKKITPEGVFPINPETGLIIQLQDQGTEEWKTKIMIPGKRGKKKVIKKENLDT